jgi:hypothetical protein
MHGRTFFRIMIDTLFVNNPIGKAIALLVNFCNNYTFYNRKKLKFLKKMPLDNKDTLYNYNKKFIFDSSKLSGVNLK